MHRKSSMLHLSSRLVHTSIHPYTPIMTPCPMPNVYLCSMKKKTSSAALDAKYDFGEE